MILVFEPADRTKWEWPYTWHVMRAAEYAARYRFAPDDTRMESEEKNRLLSCALTNTIDAMEYALHYLIRAEEKHKDALDNRGRLTDEQLREALWEISFWQCQAVELILLYVDLGLDYGVAVDDLRAKLTQASSFYGVRHSTHECLRSAERHLREYEEDCEEAEET